MPRQILQVSRVSQGQRLDKFLSETALWPSRSFVQKIIEAGGVSHQGVVLKANYRLQENDEIEINWSEPRALEVLPQKIPLDILFEDQDLIVVNKPRQMVVHPAAGNYQGTLVNALLDHCRDLSGIGGVIRPGIVHRLDKDTSGILVVAKNDFAHLELANQIKVRSMKRVYQLLVHGSPPDSGQINYPLGRHPVERKKIAVVAKGKPAVTHFQVLERIGAYTFLEARLETGRTHQIRVHFSYLGYPLVGDQVYGHHKERVPLKGQALHAVLLGFIHPRTGHYLEFTAAVPTVMQEALAWCRRNG